MGNSQKNTVEPISTAEPIGGSDVIEETKSNIISLKRLYSATSQYVLIGDLMSLGFEYEWIITGIEQTSTINKTKIIEYIYRNNQDKYGGYECIKMPVVIQCRSDSKYDCNFNVLVPYHKSYKYSINMLIFDAFLHFNKQYHPNSFRKKKIRKNSFLDRELIFDDNNDNISTLSSNIMDYPMDGIKDIGLYIEIEKIEQSLYQENMQKKENIKVVLMPVIVECPRNMQYNDNFTLSVPYDTKNAYSIDLMIKDIMDKVNYKQRPFKFVAVKIKSDSFMGREIVYDDYDWTDSVNKITDYVQLIIEQMGVYLEIDLEIYQHKTISLDVMCPDMNNQRSLCPIYAKMRYQDIFSEEYWTHLCNYSHFGEIKCKYGDECYAFKRLENGGNALNDRCHIMIYKHPPRGRMNIMSEGINSFCLNDEWDENVSLYHPSNDDKKESKYNEQDGFLTLLIAEVIQNGYKSDLCIREEDEENNNYTLLMVVDEKIKCQRHKMMGSPLNRSEMLSLLLYTGGDSNYDLCKSQRNRNYIKWKWFDFCLYNAISKLSKREDGAYKIYTGLSSTRLPHKYVECGYFKSYVSTSWIKQIAETFVNDKGMIFEIDEHFREQAICCDVSWISKFGISECEILIDRYNMFKI